jgi:hypothetical protein
MLADVWQVKNTWLEARTQTATAETTWLRTAHSFTKIQPQDSIAHEEHPETKAVSSSPYSLHVMLAKV